jgi:apolipoprotein N-acyltransferase
MWLAVLLSALSGAMLTVGFPALNWYPVAWFALVPLFFAIKGRTNREAFALGYLCGMVHFATALYWILFVVDHYGGLALPVAVFVLLLLCAYLAIYPAFFALIAQKLERYPYVWMFVLPGVWVSLEWVRGHVLTGFPWADLGYTQTPFIRLVQIADITGVYGVSWLVVFGNTAVMAVFGRPRLRPVLGITLLGILMIGATLYGSERIKAVDRIAGKASSLTVGVVQGNIDQSKKWDPAFQQATLKRYKELSLEASRHDPRPQLLVWPETAAPFFYGIEDRLTDELNRMIEEVGVPLLFGSPAVTASAGQPRLQNRAYLVNASAKLLGAYAKQHLVPFGEYVPLKKYLFFVHRLVQAAGDFVPGHDPSPLTLGSQKLGVLICYEGIFPELARETIRRGATCLVNITNDAWYGRTSAPYQHLEMERWLSIEFRMPLVRAANTGVSAIFDATGRPCGYISLDQPGELVCTIHPHHNLTFYAKWGDLFTLLCALTVLAGLLYSSQRLRSLFSR